MNNRVIKILTLSGVGGISSVANIFIISAILMEEKLKKRGNAFVASVAMADFGVTGIGISSATVALLANAMDWDPVCKIQWHGTLFSAFVTIWSLAAVAVDAKLQMIYTNDEYLSAVTVNRVWITMATVWISSGMSLGVLLVLDQDVPTCHSGKSPLWNAWQLPGVVYSFHLVFPLVLTSLLYFTSWLNSKRNNSQLPSSFRINLIAFFVFAICWIPLIFAMFFGLSTLQGQQENLVYLHWLAVAKSCVNPFIYATCDKHFRQAFVNLFHYCCCKSSSELSRRVKLDSLRPTSDVRVHIIPGYNVYHPTTSQASPNRDIGENRDVFSSRGPRKSKANRITTKSAKNHPDVYEL